MNRRRTAPVRAAGWLWKRLIPPKNEPPLPWAIRWAGWIIGVGAAVSVLVLLLGLFYFPHRGGRTMSG